jgi:hypothetical protein
MPVPAPLRDPSEPRFSFSYDELEHLARHEHDGCVQSKEADG